jgi:hypothetical protein
VTKVKLTGVFPVRSIEALSAPIAMTIGSKAPAGTAAITSIIATPISTRVRCRLPAKAATCGGPEHEERDKLGNGGDPGQLALTESRGELRAVAAHEGDEEALQVQITDRIDNAGKRRKKAR